MVQSDNPYALNPGWDEIQVAAPETHLATGRPGKVGTWILLVVVALTCAIGGVLALVQIESIIGSGIVLAVVCAILWFQESWAQRHGGVPFFPARLLAGSGLTFVVGVFAIILTNEMSPLRADRAGVDVACAAFGAFGFALVIWGLLRFPNQRVDASAEPY